MGERKVQAKYYPPDFDPSRLPRIKKKRQNDDAVRFMLPMSVRCETCGDFMGTGLKFNARKSDTEETYLGIRIFRFSMKCKGCPATFIIKTDPKNGDYICESGVRRNYEPWRAAKDAEEEGKEERKRQDDDAIQALENKTRDAKEEMEELDALDELKSLNAKRARVNVEDVLSRGRDAEKRRVDAEELEILREAKIAFEQRRNLVGKFDASERHLPTPRSEGNPKRMGNDPNQSTPKRRAFGLKIVKTIKKANSLASAVVKSDSAKTTASSDQDLVGYDSSSSDGE
ncbi:Coiled-coil domain-containing protein, putative [Chondrus crispus]|uniref:Splicing factor YJU2 n=1 Tax=Chondrus crispus TaxID=2769 RepID=R7Q7N3_CHOCR|nr:Coiled-coil domain-containing protein, putative [Chondrus crispus]CDF34542.1 Coiled-coil domain-containing protein, putative [Chondrus crispus]|eukprot:XP_005714361.1 Coiled-coil domain-containing protein, putative [Chondrus crispus]